MASTFLRPQYLGFHVLHEISCDNLQLLNLIDCYERDGSVNEQATTVFQVPPGVGMMETQWLHAHIVSTLSRDDPLSLRYAHVMPDGSTHFIYTKESNPVGPRSETFPRVTLAFFGKHPYCELCDHPMCASVTPTRPIMRELSTYPTNMNYQTKKSQCCAFLLANHDLNYNQQPKCVQWMINHLCRNFPKYTFVPPSEE